MEGNKRLLSCPQNEEHRVGSDNLQKHLSRCCWHQSGYRDDSVALPEAGRTFATTVVLDKHLQAEVIVKAAHQNQTLKIGDNVREREVPQTSDRVFSDFTTDERRILYDYVVSRTSAAVPRLSEFSLPTGEESKREPLTREQLMAAERDAKRRRVRYRTAKVHTKSKNYSEVMREVINSQMLTYEDWLKEHCNITGSSTSIPPENTNTEEPVKNNQEMVWLDWDYRTNPHIRWKYLLEQEKRRSRRSTTDTKEGASCSKDERRKYSESTSRRSSQNNKPKKLSYTETGESHRYVHDLKGKDRESRTNSTKRDNDRDYYKRRDSDVPSSRKDRYVDSSREGRMEYKSDRFRKNVFKDNRQQNEVKEERDEYDDYNSKYREYQSKGEYYKKYKYEDVNTPKYDKRHSVRDFKYHVKKESGDNSNNCHGSMGDFSSDQKHKSSEKYKNSDNESSNTESDELSDMSSNTSCNKKEHKRKKKKKKKHKRKHKSKRSRHESHSESSD